MTGMDMNNNIRKNIYMWFIIVLGIIVVVSLLVAISALMINREPDDAPIDKESISNLVQHNNGNLQDETSPEGNGGGYNAGGNSNNGDKTNVVAGDNKKDELYYLLYTRERVEIYTGDGVLYDYADIRTDLLPEEVFSELKQGMYIKGDEDLYDFLQAYSS